LYVKQYKLTGVTVLGCGKICRVMGLLFQFPRYSLGTWEVKFFCGKSVGSELQVEFQWLCQ